MPAGRTKFQESWKDELDDSGLKIGLWCQQDSSSQFRAYCLICTKAFSCANSGILQVRCHSQGRRHKDFAVAKFSPNQKHFSTAIPKQETEIQESCCSNGTRANEAKSLPSSRSLILCPSLQKQIKLSEIRWLLKLASDNYSFSSCDGLPKLFQSMFPGNISDGFQICQTKASYVISDGLGPYFHHKISKDISNGSTGYVLQYDETTTSQIKKQFDVLICFWSDDEGRVMVRFWKAIFLGHSYGNEVADKLLSTLCEAGNQIPLCRLISISSDGPNVNKAIWKFINEKIKENGYPGIMPLIPCNIHVAHNAFRAALSMYGEEAEQLALDLYYWFKLSACRREDYGQVQMELNLEEHLFLRHVECRWLSLLPALDRILKQWASLQKYFLKDVPKDKKLASSMKNERYLRICRKLTPGLEIQISFLLSAGKLFEQFVQFFQVEGPLVHLFHQQMLETTLSIMRRFLKNRVVAGKSSTELMTVDLECEENLLPLEKMEIVVPTRELLKKDSQKPLLFQMRKFYQKGADYLRSHFPIDNTLLMDLSCLDPLARKKGTERNIEKIGRIAMQMPQIVKPAAVALVTDEWKLYKYDNEIKTEWYVKEETSGKLKYNRVDEYWNLVFQLKTSTGQLKYSNLAKVVKTALCLVHGNADVERSLSLNKKTLSADRTLLKPVTINGLRTVKDAVKICSGDPILVPVTEEMINAVKHAYQVHQERLKKEAKKAETSKRQKGKDMENAKRCKEEERAMKEKKTQIVNIESLLKESEDQEQEELTTAHKLLEEANNRHTTSLKVKDFNGASVAQSFIEIASNRLESARKQMEQTCKKRKQVDTKKQQLIDAFVPSKKSKYST